MCPPGDFESVARPEAVRVWLLGGFRVSVGSRTVDEGAWRQRRAASLLKLLALAPGHRLHREQVMDLLWPNSGAKAASNSLRQVLYGARTILDPTSGSRERYLGVRDEHVILCPAGQLWVDVDAFEEAALTARRSRDTAVYRAAIDLYAGDLLPEDRYEAWAETRREGLRQLHLTLLLELAGLHEERGGHGLAIEVLREVIAKEPTLEGAHVSLMRLQALLGRPEQAIAQYERLRDALSRELGTKPAPASLRLRDEVAAGKLSATPPTGPSSREQHPDAGKHNLPAPRTSFVGREREMVEVKRLLSMTRLLTLTGAGGSGKTRLALEVAKELVGAYPDGVWMVELAPLSDPNLVAQGVAGALKIQERPGRSLVDTLADTLDDKELLLVMDNCEHLVKSAAQLVDALLDSCPRLKVLATSREPLGVPGEVNRPVPPLSMPSTTDGGINKGPTAESLMRYEAVRLFVDRARLRLPDFGLTRENAGAVARVCRRLDGIPLAIELATARMGALAVEQVAQRLETSLDVLKGASRTAAPRQQTLRATLDWSFDLLTEVERTLFRRLSVFAGRWPLEAAEEVCSGGGIEQEDVLDLLSGLVDKSLVGAGASTGGVVRYGMLEPIRQYAREKLEDSGETDAVRDRHVAFFLAVAEDVESELAGPQQKLWVERLEGEHDNMREALSSVLDRGKSELALRLGAALWRFWHLRGYLSEGIRWLERVLAGDEPVASPVWVKALEGMGWLTQWKGNAEQAKAAYEEMLKLSRELGDNGNIATALNSLGTVAAQQGEHERARALLEENLVVLRVLEDEGNTAAPLERYHVLNLLGLLALDAEGDFARAMVHWEESLALAREVGDPSLVGITLSNLGYVALLQSEHERAAALCKEALALARDLGSAGVEIIPETCVNLGLAALGQGESERAAASFKEALVMSQNTGRMPSIINTLEGMASLAGNLGDATRAARLWGAAEAAREVTGFALPSGDRVLHESYLAAARSRLGEAVWEQALSEGRAMPLDRAAEYALSREESAAPATSVPEGPPAARLTHREQDVALLVARGLTNRQISTNLGISERTAGNHVARILRKLGLRSRAQIATWATEHHPSTPPNPD